jgi:hypothetical protein
MSLRASLGQKDAFHGGFYMKKVLVKKGAGAIAFAIVLGLVAFAACEQPTDSDPTPAPVEKGKGVVGQVSGVVYDSVTGAFPVLP